MLNFSPTSFLIANRSKPQLLSGLPNPILPHQTFQHHNYFSVVACLFFQSSSYFSSSHLAWLRFVHLSSVNGIAYSSAKERYAKRIKVNTTTQAGSYLWKRIVCTVYLLLRQLNHTNIFALSFCNTLRQPSKYWQCKL